MTARLDKKHWISAGLKALAAGGADAVLVERLAKTLCVTKGSFYWHFKNRDALLEAVLDAWKKRATNDIIAEVEKRGGNARSRLRSLFTIVLAADGRLDREVRVWANKDAAALAAVEEIDTRRLSYLVSLFQSLGFTPLEATARARFAYHALIGQHTMGAPAQSAGQLSKQFEIVFEMLVNNSG